MSDESEAPAAGFGVLSRAGVERSPNYPSIALTQAIELAQRWYEREKRTTVAPEVGVKALGYTSMSGSARTAIAALRQYGLLESAKDGLRITDLAMDIIHQPIGSVERTKALRSAAVRPPLIAELMESHGDASDDSLRAYLVTKRKFSPDGAGRFVPAFREAVGIARLPELHGSEAKQSSGKDFEYPKPQKERIGWVESVSRPAQPGDSMNFNWDLGGDVVASMSVSKNITLDDVETLEANLEAAKRAIVKQAKANQTKPLSTAEVNDNAP